jgi:hypothetical protein
MIFNTAEQITDRTRRWISLRFFERERAARFKRIMRRACAELWAIFSRGLSFASEPGVIKKHEKPETRNKRGHCSEADIGERGPARVCEIDETNSLSFRHHPAL